MKPRNECKTLIGIALSMVLGTSCIFEEKKDALPLTLEFQKQQEEKNFWKRKSFPVKKTEGTGRVIEDKNRKELYITNVQLEENKNYYLYWSENYDFHNISERVDKLEKRIRLGWYTEKEQPQEGARIILTMTPLHNLSQCTGKERVYNAKKIYEEGQLFYELNTKLQKHPNTSQALYEFAYALKENKQKEHRFLANSELATEFLSQLFSNTFYWLVNEETPYRPKEKNPQEKQQTIRYLKQIITISVVQDAARYNGYELSYIQNLLDK